MSFWNYLMYRAEQKTIQKVLDNRSKVLEMIDNSFSVRDNTLLRENIMSTVDNDLKAVLEHFKV